MGKKPRTQACTVCSYPRKFTEMRRKLGKDGRVARWPEYEPCPNKDNPKFHPSAANLRDLTEEIHDPILKETIERLQTTKEFPVGVMYQVNDKDDPLDEIAQCLLHYEEKLGALPIAIGIHPEDAGDFSEIDWETEDGKEVAIPIWKQPLTGNYGYILLITELK